jgi:ATP synthase F1, epsilon subunit
VSAVALSVQIVSRSKGVAWSGEVSQVSVPLVDGELGVLPGRAPIVAILGTGRVRLTPLEGEAVAVPVRGGFCSVDHDTVTVAADKAGDEAMASEPSPASGTEPASGEAY